MADAPGPFDDLSYAPAHPTQQPASGGQRAAPSNPFDDLGYGKPGNDAIPLPPPAPPGEPPKDSAFEVGAMGVRNAMNTALFNIPRHVLGAAPKMAIEAIAKREMPTSKRYMEIYNEERQRDADLAARHPVVSGVGTGLGVVGSLAVPLGAVGRLGAAGKAGAASAGALLSGGSSYIEDQDVQNALTNAGIGAAAGVAMRPLAAALASKFNGISRVGGVSDASGNLSPEAMRVIQTTIPGMEAADIQKVSQEFANVFRKKGITPAAAREGLLAVEGVPASRTLATGLRPPVAAAEAAGENLGRARAALGEGAQDLAGAAPSPIAVAQSLQDAQVAAHNAASQQYSRAFGHAGEFHGDIANGVLPAINRSLAQSNVPPISGMLNLPQYQNSRAAIDLIQKTMGQGNMPLGPKLDMANLESVRKGLNALRRGNIDPEDKRALGVIISGYDNNIMGAVNNGLFSGNGQAVIRDLQQARSMYSDLQRNFYSRQVGVDSVVSRALKHFQQHQTFDAAGNKVPDIDPATAQIAQGILNSNILNKSLGAGVYNKLMGIFGGPNTAAGEALTGHLRASIANPADGLGKMAKNIEDFLDPRGPNIQLAGRIFSPDEISRLRRMSAAARIIEAKPIPDPAKENAILQAAKSFGLQSIIPGLATMLHSPIMGMLTFAAERPLVGAGNAIRTNRAIRAENAGAPLRPAFVGTQAIPNLDTPSLDQVTQAGRAAYDLARPGRASGGAVNATHERLVNRLMRLANEAKKSTNQTTKPLLKMDDNTIARALQTADNAI